MDSLRPRHQMTALAKLQDLALAAAADVGPPGDPVAPRREPAGPPPPRAARHTLRATAAAVQALAYAPGAGGRLATAGDDRLVHVWDAAAGTLLASLRGAQGGLTAVAWAPDGRLLAAGGADKAVRLWDVASGRERVALTGHADRVVAAAFSPLGEGGGRLISAAQDRCIKARVRPPRPIPRMLIPAARRFGTPSEASASPPSSATAP